MGVSLATFTGAPDGMRRDQPQHQISDTACWTLIDAWLDRAGIIERRSPVRAIYGSAYASASQAAGMAGTTNPAGTWVGLYLASRDSDNTGRLVAFRGGTIDTAFGFDPATAPHPIFDSKAALKGGTLIGAASDIGANPTSQCLLLYRGATLGVGVSRALTAPIARGDLTFTVTAGGTDFTPGGFVFDTSAGTLIGEVKSVSGETITLVDKAIAPGTDNVQVRPVRRLLPRVSKGRITCATTSATVNGGLTQFRKLGLGTGSWDLFTTDLTYIGTVLSVGSDTQLELTASATVDLLNSDYIAIQQADADDLTTTPFGIINAVHAGHQFYARGNEVMYSDDDDREAVDTVDDTFSFSADDITGMVSTEVALLVMSTRETHILQGAVGTTPDRWTGDVILDDGALSPMVCQSYKGGAVWAGHRGVYYWAGGGTPQVISAALGDTYEKIMNARQTNTRVWSACTRDHYLLYVEGTDQTEIRAYLESTVAGGLQDGDPLERFCIAINLENGAITVLLNMGIKGYVAAPDAEYTVVTAVTSGHASARATVIDLDELWLDDSAPSAGTDVHVDVLEEDSRVYPQFALETKKYDFGNPQILKLVKLFLLHFRLGGTNDGQAAITAETADCLRFATVKGMQTSGAVAGKRLFPVADGDVNGQWQDKRVKFMKRSQFLSMRIWQGTNTITRLELGAWALGFKQKRPGRV